MEIPATFRGAVLVAAGDDALFEHYAGFADRTDGSTCGPSTRFQIASVSKQFAAACVLLLAETGRLSIDDPIGRWFADSPPSWDSVSLHHLLTHTSGLGHFPDYDFDVHQPLDDGEFLHRLRERPLPDDIPTAWYYSSPAYGLLARVVERASDVPYREFLTHSIFEPLAMRDTFAGNGDGRPNLAAGYTGDEPALSMDLDSMSMGAGDIWSTVQDLDRWNRAVLSEQLLSRDSRERMFTSYASIEDFPIPAGYGYGWMITSLQDRRLYAHSGDNVGYSSLNIVVPSDRLRIVILTNEHPADVLTLATSLFSQSLERL